MNNPTQTAGENRLYSSSIQRNLVENSPLFTHSEQSHPNFAKMHEKQNLRLTTSARSPYSAPAFAKSKAEPQNSQFISVANTSTPLNRAFFVRSSRTPKERQKMACSSMVACSGKGFALCCIPLIAVSEPVARYRPITLRSEAIAPKNLSVELSAMQKFAYSFLCVNRTADTYQEEVIRIIADSEQNARLQLSADYRLLLPRPIAKICLKPTACTAKGAIYA